MENSLDHVQKCSSEFFSGVDSAAITLKLMSWTSPMPMHRPMPYMSMHMHRPVPKQKKRRRKGQKVKRRLTRFENVRGVNDNVN